MSNLPLYQVDAFTSQVFRGNPAAVCLLSAPLPDATLQAIAAEMNLSETAFLLRAKDEPWEVPLCGHATLSAAAVLFEAIGVATEELAFHTLSGVLLARRDGARVHLDFPVDPPLPCKAPLDVLASLGLPEARAAAYGDITRKLLLELDTPQAIRELTPNFGTLLAAESMAQFKGLIVTATGDAPYDFCSRYFAPWVGINEDPVTGSAHTLLAPYWSAQLHRDTFLAHQASARGGELWVSLKSQARVDIAGEAVIVLEGTLRI